MESILSIIAGKILDIIEYILQWLRIILTGGIRIELDYKNAFSPEHWGTIDVKRP